MRIHTFHRAAPGLWSCLNAGCRLDRPVDWPFGAIHHRAADICACGAPLFEILSCAACGEAYLNAQETSANRLVQPPQGRSVDDFALDADRDADEIEENDEDAEPAPVILGERKLIGVNAHRGLRWLCVEQTSGQVFDHDEPGTVRLPSYDYLEPHYCPACNTQAAPGGDLIRPIRFAAPFILGSATPILLEGAARAPDADNPDHWIHDVAPPASGRQLLSFTDSRQGTARLSAKLQVASERNFIRTFVYHVIQHALTTASDPAQLAVLDTRIAKLEAVAGDDQELGDMLKDLQDQRSRLANAGLAGISWSQIADQLAERAEVRVWMKGSLVEARL